MKKALLITLVIVLAFSFAGCGSKKATAKLTILDESLTPEEYGIGFAKDNEDLCYAVEAALMELKDKGELKPISEKWFGEDKVIIESDADVANVDKDALPKTLKLGLDASFPPMGYTDEDGSIKGFDIDLAKAVCDFYGIKLEPVPIEWDQKDAELQTGNIDCIWNGLTITDERLENYCMSAPYLANRQVVVVAEGSTIKDIKGLAGKKVALQSDSSADDAIKANPELDSSIGEKVYHTDNLLAISDLKTGNVDAVVMDEVVASYIISQDEAE